MLLFRHITSYSFENHSTHFEFHYNVVIMFEIMTQVSVNTLYNASWSLNIFYKPVVRYSSRYSPLLEVTQMENVNPLSSEMLKLLCITQSRHQTKPALCLWSRSYLPLQLPVCLQFEATFSAEIMFFMVIYRSVIYPYLVCVLY